MWLFTSVQDHNNYQITEIDINIQDYNTYKRC